MTYRYIELLLHADGLEQRIAEAFTVDGDAF
jgi:hypothetical protein